ncbi:MAG: N-6 DNA methylase [Candidatus Competibacteraceae bacterium]|nr:N-6 DNA methylase [Candidatus Competibacteraceae bacterium]MCB1821016.1 N-6 DNA methylase [Candidatus Competibacteraceae bacterium]
MTDPLLLDHRRWLGYAQPVGLVVSPPALLDAQAYLNRNIATEHRAFLAEMQDIPLPDGLTAPAIRDWPRLLVEQFGWQAGDLQDAPPSLWFALPEYHDVLRASHAVRALNPLPGANPWLALMHIEPKTGRALDEPLESAGWPVSPQARFERLLREMQIPLGLLSNGLELRLIYAPRGESSGTLAFPIAAMRDTDGRILFAALHLLLSAERWFTLPEAQRLPAILIESRKYQNTVSTQLAAQVLAALYELLRGFQAADAQVNGALLGDLAKRDLDAVYGGLLTVLLRLIFILYAEDRGLISTDPVYVNHYAVSGLFERLRADAGQYPDTMDLRFGAWAQLLALFRLIHGGGRHGELRLTARRGRLFDAAIYPFLEGAGTPLLPRVSDGVIYRVLANLLMLNGERLSYRSLDMEHIGSVYEAMMGFTLLRAPGPMIAIKPAKAHGVPVMIDLAALLATLPKNRAKVLKDDTDQVLTGAALTALQKAATQADLLAALESKIDNAVTPDVAPAGALVLQPTDERCKTGSHYTPPELTRPMVQEALRPILARLGESPTPEQLLRLKVCDPAMGSGAFLVETGKQLAEALVQAWRDHRCLPELPPDEDELLHARRLMALHVLYGVDKNPRAVELAQLSLWLATLARDHEFTFLDHALKCGDSLVGMNLAALRPSGSGQKDWVRSYLEQRIQDALQARARIREAEALDEATLRGWLQDADVATADLRWSGDQLVAAALQPGSKAARTQAEKAARARIEQRLSASFLPSPSEREAGSESEIRAFHWELEFPEVFGRDNPGFDVIVGNPPFVGGKKIKGALGTEYRDYLVERIAHGQRGNADLCAYFFLRAGQLLRDGGMMALLATNTIAQGDTREVGLDQLTAHSFSIPRAVPSVPWPGEAGVEVAQVWLYRGAWPGDFVLNGQPVAGITPFLTVPGQVAGKPYRLAANADQSFQGSIVLGMGFVLTPDEAQALLDRNPRNKACLFPYLNGEDLNSHFDQSPSRWVINFHDWPLNREADGVWRKADARQQREWLRSGIVPADYPDPVAADYPDLLAIVEEKVKPERTRRNENGEFVLRYPQYLKWWIYSDKRPKLYSTIVGMGRVLVCSEVTKYLGFNFVANGFVYSANLDVFPNNELDKFSVLQSSIHIIWAHERSATLETRLKYSPGNAYETFPFPLNLSGLDDIGERYYEHRQSIMQTRREGLTATYNRFHNPHERAPDIQKLRDLHVAMDEAVAVAYGWHDLALAHDFHDTKQGVRFTVSEAARRELLDRLLALNHQRHEEEVAAAIQSNAIR